MPSFTPPPSTPSVTVLAPPRYGAEPLSVASHGYRYTVTGNTLLPPTAITRTLAKAPTPKEALAALQDIYHKAGYNLVAITAQLLGDIVKVSVFEGTVTNVKIPKGLGWFFPGLEGRNDVTDRELVQDQILAGAYAERSGQKVNVNVSPAPNPGGTDLTVTAPPLPDYQPVSGTLAFGNYGSRYSSGYVIGGDVTANLTHGLQVTANYVHGLPSLRESSFGSTYYAGGLGISSVTPYGTYGFAATATHFRLGEAAAPLFPNGDIYTYKAYGTQLLYADVATRVALTESINRTSYEETVLDGAFTLLAQRYQWATVGASFSHSLTLAGQPGSITGDASFDLGLSAPAGTLVDGEPGLPTPHFRYGTISAAYQQHLPHGFQLDVTGQAQMALNTLPVSQQWILGGFGSLDAWEPGVVVGDSGYLARAEISAPAVQRFSSQARFGVFIETGGATFTTPAAGTAPWQTLSDVGASLRLQLPYKFSVTAMAAIPVRSDGFNAVGRSNLDLNRIDAFFVVQKRF